MVRSRRRRLRSAGAGLGSGASEKPGGLGAAIVRLGLAGQRGVGDRQPSIPPWQGARAGRPLAWAGRGARDGAGRRRRMAGRGSSHALRTPLSARVLLAEKSLRASCPGEGSIAWKAACPVPGGAPLPPKSSPSSHPRGLSL